jgi:hypothetical protein
MVTHRQRRWPCLLAGALGGRGFVSSPGAGVADQLFQMGVSGRPCSDTNAFEDCSAAWCSASQLSHRSPPSPMSSPASPRCGVPLRFSWGLPAQCWSQLLLADGEHSGSPSSQHWSTCSLVVRRSRLRQARVVLRRGPLHNGAVAHPADGGARPRLSCARVNPQRNRRP